MHKISVIVPVYKIEKYLNKCVESILNQTYKNLEIILVDDGSPDNCPKMCDYWAKKDERIKVIHKKNGGVSSARNAGLDIATGDFIGFVDGDDYLDSYMYEELHKTIVNEESQISFCNMKRVFEDGSFVNIVDVTKNIKKSDIFKLFFLGKCKKEGNTIYNTNIMGSVCRCLFITNIAKKIKFVENISYCEDLLYILEYLKLVDKISITEKTLYFYFQRETSFIHTFDENKIKNAIESTKITEKIIKNFEPKIQAAIKFSLYKFLFINIAQLPDKKIRKKYIKIIEKFKFNTSYNYKMYKYSENIKILSREGFVSFIARHKLYEIFIIIKKIYKSLKF